MTANYMLEKQETGRSMIEMLGVLAIIGVLSVGGIAGYMSAMRSHRANEIVNATSMLFMQGLASNVGEGTQPMDLDGNILPSGCKGIHYNGDKATLTVNIEDEIICKQVKTKLGDRAGDCTAATAPATGYTLTVTLGEEGGDTFTCNPTCENGQVCINGFCEDKAVCGNYDFYFMRQNKCINEIYCENTENGTGIIDYNAITCDFSCNNGYHLIFDEWGGISCVSDETNSFCDETNSCCNTQYADSHKCECDNDYRTDHIYECGGTDAEKYASCLSSFGIYGEEATKSICPNYVQCMNSNELHCDTLFWGPDCRPCILSGKDSMECAAEGKC